ncbi:unnamed protein product [Peronospora belbahrii]|uniref:Uncharacterized protein n=1 Tax=Peronospora belbahrii TaxID=622444 RepID=A0ABN8D9P1_9STRA|nr:unnamed protein product [Peronospora belbahrii]
MSSISAPPIIATPSKPEQKTPWPTTYEAVTPCPTISHPDSIEPAISDLTPLHQETDVSVTSLQTTIEPVTPCPSTSSPATPLATLPCRSTAEPAIPSKSHCIRQQASKPPSISDHATSDFISAY